MARTARLWRGRFKVQTMSAHEPARFARLAAIGPDALIFSTVFPSQSPTASRPTGAIGLRRIARAAPISLYALGGISPANAQSVASQAGLAAVDGWTCFAGIRQDPDFRT
jgi:thiamine monophosphate synthase